MGTITLIVLGLTLAGMAFGALFGFLRGRERALLRLVLVIISAILAIVLRGAIFDAVVSINIDGSTLKATLISADVSLSSGLQNLILALLEIIIGFISYFILLFALRFLTWLLVFPFLKLIIRKFESETAGHKGQGALVGLAQGLLLSYFLFAPLTCLLTQINNIASLEINGKPIFELQEESDISKYSESFIGKFYYATGYWYYDIMTTITDDNGNEVSLDNAFNSISTILEVANVAYSFQDDLKIIGDENATPEEVISSLNNLGDKLISVGTSLDEIDDGTKNIIKDLIVEMSGEDASQEDIDKVLDNLSPEIFTQAGHAIKSYTEYEQIKLDGAELTQNQASNIVENVYNSIDLLESTELDVNDADKSIFKAAIDSNADIAAEDVATMYKIFGIETP